jgi:hypothetical protein
VILLLYPTLLQSRALLPSLPRESDYPHMLAVINGSKKADGIERSDTLESFANNYAHLEM